MFSAPFDTREELFAVDPEDLWEVRQKLIKRAELYKFRMTPDPNKDEFLSSWVPNKKKEIAQEAASRKRNKIKSLFCRQLTMHGKNAEGGELHILFVLGNKMNSKACDEIDKDNKDNKYWVMTMSGATPQARKQDNVQVLTWHKYLSDVRDSSMVCEHGVATKEDIEEYRLVPSQLMHIKTSDPIMGFQPDLPVGTIIKIQAVVGAPSFRLLV